MLSIRFHLLTHPTKFVGDKNQLLGTLKAFKQITHFNLDAIETKEWNYTDADALANLQDEVSSTKKIQHVILSSGEQGLKTLKNIRVDKSVLSSWSAHQQFSEIKEISDKINILALPHYSIDETFRATLSKEILLVETMGVAHMVSQQGVAQAFSEWQLTPAAIKKSDEYIAVVLGGDASVNGEMKYFTKPEAEMLAEYVAELAIKNNAHVLVTNSPRTRGGVAERFNNVLEANYISYQFFGFVPNTPSAYQPMLGALLANRENIAIVTADSESMVAEMSYILKCTLMLANVGSTRQIFFDHVKKMFPVIQLNSAGKHCEVEETKEESGQVTKPAGLAIATTIEQQLTLRMRAANQAAPAIHFFASRRNGVNTSSPDSSWRYGKGNVFAPKPEHPENENAVKNTDAILSEFKLDTAAHPGVILQSQYEAGICVVDEVLLANPKRIVIKGDGLFTTLRNVPLLNKSGDAHPIVFESEKAIGILVGSWKCLGKQILTNMLKLFEANGIEYKDITVYIGPGLGSDSYSIGSPTRADLAKIFGDAIDVATRLKADGSKYILNVHALMAEYSQQFGFTVNFSESSNTFNKTEWKLIKKQAIEEKDHTVPIRYYSELPFFGARLFARAVRQAYRVAHSNGKPMPEELTTLKGNLENVKTAAADGRYDETGRCLNGVMQR